MATAPKPNQPAEEPVTASAKPAVPAPSQTASQPTPTLIQPTTTPADTDAKARHEETRRQILDVFRGFCNDAREHLSGTPLKERFYVFHVKLRDPREKRGLQEKLGEVLRQAGEDYTRMAIAYRSELGTDPLSWVEAQLKADRDRITREDFEYWIGQGSALMHPLTFRLG